MFENTLHIDGREKHQRLMQAAADWRRAQTPSTGEQSQALLRRQAQILWARVFTLLIGR